VAEVRISAEQRTEFGKGGARRTRRAGKLPAVLYGHGTEPRHISLPTRDFEHALRTDGANVLLSLELDNGSELALPKSIQRDPVRGQIEHVDLILVRRGEKITVDVPVIVTGDVVSGGLLDQQLTVLSVAAEATHIPSSFEVSIDGLQIGDAIHAKDVQLPSGTELAGEGETVVVHILAAPTAEQLEGEVAEGEADLGAGDEAATGDSGQGDVVPDTETSAGGPGEGGGAGE
jgi:large subunit ribosomal protein L25